MGLTNIMGNCGSSSGAAGFRQVEKKLAGHSSTPGRKPEKTVVFGSQFGMYGLHIQKAAPGKVSSGAAGFRQVEKKLAGHSSTPGRLPEKTVVFGSQFGMYGIHIQKSPRGKAANKTPS